MATTALKCQITGSAHVYEVLQIHLVTQFMIVMSVRGLDWAILTNSHKIEYVHHQPSTMTTFNMHEEGQTYSMNLNRKKNRILYIEKIQSENKKLIGKN